jgi:iron(III) transport system ATP-binding protein
MIELKNISIRYGSFTAVHDLNVEIRDGEFFTFLGPSGCGKTTTLRAIAGFETPAAGTITAFGRDLSGLLPEERGLGFVFQNYALFPSMSVYENIAFGLKAHKVPKKEILPRVQAIAEKTGITEHLHKKITELSGGQQQRIAIARALVLEPKVLLMDEPLSNLDAKLRVSTREEIRKLQRALGITTIYVTHDQEEAMAISDRIAVFNVGRIEQVASPKEIYNHPANAAVARFIGDINCLGGTAKQELRQTLGCGDDESLFIRPHKVRITKQPQSTPGSSELAAVIDSFEFLGAYTKIIAKTPDNCPITALMFGSETEFAVGETVYVQFRHADVLALREG